MSPAYMVKLRFGGSLEGPGAGSRELKAGISLNDMPGRCQTEWIFFLISAILNYNVSEL